MPTALPRWTGEPVAVGLVGAGPWARAMHAPVLARGPATRLAAVWARRPEAATELAERFGTVSVATYDDLLDACEAAAFAVPPDVQADLAPRAARAGRAVVLEKPLGLDLDQARTVADAVRTADVPNILVLTKRFHPSTEAFLEAAADLRAAGPVTGVSAAYLHGAVAGGGAAATPWRVEHGALLDLGPHLVDLVDAAAGPIRSVRAAGDPRTYLTIATEHDGGVGQLALSGAAALDHAVTRVEVFSDHGSARWDTAGIDHTECWPVLCAEFAHAVRHGRAVRADVTRGLWVQIVLDAVARSLVEDRRVTITSRLAGARRAQHGGTPVGSGPSPAGSAG